MEYSDAENIRWWDGLTRGDRVQLAMDIAERCTVGRIAEACANAINRIKAGERPEAKDIAIMRKWWHR